MVTLWLAQLGDDETIRLLPSQQRFSSHAMLRKFNTGGMQAGVVDALSILLIIESKGLERYPGDFPCPSERKAGVQMMSKT